MIKVVLVDDHVLLRNGLASLINSFGKYQVIYEADNGKEFIEKLKQYPLPDLVLLDITMPEMDGFETAKWIQEHHPDIKILVLSMMDNDTAIIRMLKFGAKGYLLKDSKPEVLRRGLDAIMEKGFYLNDLVTGKLVHFMNHSDAESIESRSLLLNERETEFLRFCCTEKSYKEIAEAMKILPRAVEKLRSDMFEKLGTSSRVGLVLYAIRTGLVMI